MIVLQYEVFDLLSEKLILDILSGEVPKCVKLYAKKGTEGLLEDFLTEKKFAFFEPVEVEVADDFNYFTITFSSKVKEIDLASLSGRIFLTRPRLEPSEN
jgi:hypothetical protein